MDLNRLHSCLVQLAEERAARPVDFTNQAQPNFTRWNNPPLWSLTYRLTTRMDEGEGTAMGWLLVLTVVPFVLLVAIDVVHAAVRLLLYPVVLCLWWLERRRALLQGRTFFCEHCHHDMKDPVLLCPTPGCSRRLQPPLRPTYNALVTRLCPGCRRKRWWIVGQRFGRRPGLLLCLETNGASGCGRQILLPALMGGSRCHIALAGTSVRAKHAGLAGCLQALTEGSVQGERYRAASKLGQLELELARLALCRGLVADTSRFEHLGESYTLARSLVLLPQYRGPTVVLHNLPASLIEQPQGLARSGCNWKAIHRLLLIVDGEGVDHEQQLQAIPDAEVYTRLVRDLEEYLGWPPGRLIPLRVAVLVVFPPRTTGTERKARSWLIHRDPALWAILVRSLRPRDVEVFTGTIAHKPEGQDLSWLANALSWLIR